MNNNQIRYFSILYECRQLSLAARAIPMSHQGLSKSIAKLEAELGVELFIEQGSLLSPTRYADALYDFCSEYLRQYNKLLVEFKRIDTQIKNEINLGASTGVFGFLGENFFKAFVNANPSIKISRLELPDLVCDTMLKNNEYNLAFTVYPFDPEFNTVELFRVERFIWISAEDPLSAADKNEITFSDLEGYYVGTMGPSFKNYTDLLEKFESEKITPARIECASEMLWLYQYAQTVQHVSFTVPHIAEFFKKERSVVARPILGIPWGFGISWCKGCALTEAEHKFVDFCVEFAAKNFKSIQKLAY
ncbi:LysR family transcriptional regulator [Eggerthella sp. YY7918]|uniref:LysR family transcriptional regulator n=1 Tax=Eggerthella sp. (strain YY7918) TaxID=502558 RepID=UPI0002171863|nr:LysR family transcriptional regulator [Eggerthella sp. YY7918]BAK45666.1 transcriptional regulator [Eggerthella sp. YY7918]